MGGAMHPREAMVDRLVADGALTDPAWAEVFRRVPRHAFVPNVAVVNGRRIDRATDPDVWLAACYADEAVGAATRDGGHGGPMPPSVAARLLEALDVRDWHHVLEIGTGTGWTAALLCARLGSGTVTTVEPDRAVAATAHRTLYQAGFTPTVA